MTNNKFSLNIENDDARYAIFECSNEKQHQYKYFAGLAECFNEECADVFFSYLYHLDDPVEIRNIPETKLRKEMKLRCLPSAKKFLCRIKDMLEDGDLQYDDSDSAWIKGLTINIKRQEYEIQAKVVYTYYKEFCAEENERPLSLTKFGSEISEHITKLKTNVVKYDISTIQL